MKRLLLVVIALLALGGAVPGDARALMPDGSFIKTAADGRVFRVIGGSLFHVLTCEPFAGCAGVVEVNPSELAAYAPQPREGTFVHRATGTGAGTIARVVGGFLMGLGTCETIGGCPGTWSIDAAPWDSYATAHPVVADGTFVQVLGGAASGRVLRAAGGHLFDVTSCEPLGGCPGIVAVDPTGVAFYERDHPAVADGTKVRGMPSSRTWVIRSGRREPATDPARAVPLNDTVIESVPVAPSAPAPATPSVPAPQPVQLPVATPVARLAAEVTLRAGVRRGRRGVRMRELRITAPVGSRISVSCTRKACRPVLVTRTARTATRLRQVSGRMLLPRARLVVRVTKPGFVGLASTFVVAGKRTVRKSTSELPPA